MHGTGGNAPSRPARSFAQIPVADCPLGTIRRLGAEYEGVVAEAERAVGCVRVTMRQDTSGLYAVAVVPADIDAGCVRHAHERSLIGPGCAGDQHEANPRDHRQRVPHRAGFHGERAGCPGRPEQRWLFTSDVVWARMLDGRRLNAHTRTLGRPPHRRPPHGSVPSKLCAGTRMSRRREKAYGS